MLRFAASHALAHTTRAHLTLGLLFAIGLGAPPAGLDASRLNAQAPPYFVGLSGGYSHLYHTDGYNVQLSIMKGVHNSGTVAQNFGLVFRYVHSDLASVVPRDLDHREILGAGLSYAAVFTPKARISPTLGGSLLLLHARNSDTPFVVGGSPGLTPPNPEDYPAHGAFGAGVSMQAGIKLLLQDNVRAVGGTSVQYNVLYTAASTKAAIDFVAGFEIGFRW